MSAKDLDPSQGGCWYCHKEIEDDNDCFFSCEFDTYLHLSCLHEAIKDKNDREATIIYGEVKS